MSYRWPGIILVIFALTACSPGGQRAPGDGDGLYAPSVDGSGEDVDGLLVGHRLMASGEYELALRAYYRAAADQGLNVDVLSAIGSANLRLGRLNQAEQILRRAVEEDQTFVPAWNNLGVVLMELNQIPEAERVFHTAFALDNGESAAIRDNLRLALAKMDNPDYDQENNTQFALVRRGGGEYLLLSTPEAENEQ
ncbi:tetratricopeptide repeat protein [Psychromarinibacter halotolerans]|uniref:Tetratricopeptide repeat protein n=1 Tax=Psychromarinibacter halotolerans TaxID=1775175 RepID=A0ABV7GYH4_9RHOB|nr:tetratricopeptide repeat protein [Psychromarinibacter halotolerans]MDF0596139.1 tetratricopeptide repeat protein [Psychromarinibacter halotolerans]